MSYTACAITGKEPADHELPLDAPEDDEAPEVPIGWARVLISRRAINPAHLYIQQQKAALVQQAVSQNTSEDMTPEQVQMLTSQLEFTVACTAAAMEQATPKYLFIEEEVLVNLGDPEVVEAWAGISQLLNLTIPGIAAAPPQAATAPSE